MSHNYVLLSVLGILVCYIMGIVAHEAIVGGIRIKPGEIPIRYQATVLMDNHRPLCGGGIIGIQFILTAAHCAIETNGLISRSISVLVGTHDLSAPGVVIGVEKIYVPTEYNPRASHPTGDIAVLQLREILRMEQHNLKLLHLPRSRVEFSHYDGKVSRIGGFGWDKIFENNELIGEYSDHQFRYADAIVLSHHQCTCDHPTINITERHLCARVEQHDNLRSGVCVGDDGGPLVVRAVTVIGILSLPTADCSERGSSGIYTRVSRYRDLIRMAMQNVSNMFIHVHDV